MNSKTVPNEDEFEPAVEVVEPPTIESLSAQVKYLQELNQYALDRMAELEEALAAAPAAPQAEPVGFVWRWKEWPVDREQFSRDTIGLTAEHHVWRPVYTHPAAPPSQDMRERARLLAMQHIWADGGALCSPLEEVIDAIASALEAARLEERERCAKIAETKYFSTVDVSERLGPFTIQDRATKSCAENIARAIREDAGRKALENGDG